MNHRYAVGFAFWVTLVWVAGAFGQKPVTLSVIPISGNAVSDNEQVAIEVFVTANVDISIRRPASVDLPCSLPGQPGSVGSITALSATADPDGDFFLGPSSDGTPYLFGCCGIVFYSPSTCILEEIGDFTPAAHLSAGETRYFATYYYAVSACAQGTFDVVFEGRHNPPISTDTTRFQYNTGGFNPIPLDVIETTLTVRVGTCCDGQVCLEDDLAESCCSLNHAGSRWFEGRTCNDVLPCPECLADSECDDGQFCTGTELCNSTTGLCESGEPPTCDDGISCTVDSCSPATDSCDHNPKDALCDDGQFCNGAEFCNPATGQCQPGLPPTCSDGVACTTDSCDPVAGACENVSDDAVCDDGLFCNGVETCDESTGCVAGDDPCPPGLDCDEALDACVVQPIPTVSEWGLVILALALLTLAKSKSLVRPSRA